MKRILAFALSLVLIACAGTGAQYRPLVDLGNVDRGRFEDDLAQCQAYAAQLAGAAQTAAAGAIIGALLGAAIGGAAGSNRYQRNTLSSVGAVEGAVGGGVIGETGQRNVIRRCLAGRGYSVLM